MVGGRRRFGSNVAAVLVALLVMSLMEALPVAPALAEEIAKTPAADTASATAKKVPKETAQPSNDEQETHAAEEPPHPDAVLSYGKGEPLEWKPEWQRFEVPHAVVTGSAALAAVVAAVVGPRTDNPWRPVVSIDEDVRDALRAPTYDQQRFWRDTSDVLLTLSTSYTVIGDAAVNAGWYRASPDVAWQMVWIDAEAISLTLAYQQVFASAVSRERPYGRVCGTDELPSTTNACLQNDRYRSFFSGHTATTFAAASLNCTHGAYLKHYAGYEWIPCTLGFAVAGSTAIARVAGDMHYFTDVVTGSLVGAFTGWFVPWLHYNTGIKPIGVQLGGASVTVLPTAGGFTASGVF